MYAYVGYTFFCKLLVNKQQYCYVLSGFDKNAWYPNVESKVQHVHAHINPISLLLPKLFYLYKLQLVIYILLARQFSPDTFSPSTFCPNTWYLITLQTIGLILIIPTLFSRYLYSLINAYKKLVPIFSRLRVKCSRS